MSQTATPPLAEPLISVIIPVYNAEQFIAQCIESVMCSTLANIEIICVDDGSTDLSPQIIEAYASVDPRISLIRQNHQYAGAARNAGIRAARGRYIHFLDADDWIDASAYAAWYEIAEAKHADVCECLGIIVDSATDEELRKDRFPYRRIGIYPQLVSIETDADSLLRGLVVPWNKLYLRTFLVDNGIFFGDLICAEDRPFYYDVLFRANTYVRVDNYWIYHRINISTSLDGSDIRLEYFDVEFKSFEYIWNLAENEPESHKAIILESCINDSFHYYTKAIGTKYEESIARQLCEYWRPYLPLLGDDMYDFYWYRQLIALLTADLPDEYRDSVRSLYEAYKRKTRHHRKLNMAVRALANVGMHLGDPIVEARRRIGR